MSGEPEIRRFACPTCGRDVYGTEPPAAGEKCERDPGWRPSMFYALPDGRYVTRIDRQLDLYWLSDGTPMTAEAYAAGAGLANQWRSPMSGEEFEARVRSRFESATPDSPAPLPYAAAFPRGKARAK